TTGSAACCPTRPGTAASGGTGWAIRRGAPPPAPAGGGGSVGGGPPARPRPPGGAVLDRMLEPVGSLRAVGAGQRGGAAAVGRHRLPQPGDGRRLDADRAPRPLRRVRRSVPAGQ